MCDNLWSQGGKYPPRMKCGGEVMNVVKNILKKLNGIESIRFGKEIQRS